MLLVQKEKAGSRTLEHFFETQLQALKKQRTEIKDRIKVTTDLSQEDQMKYYSTWFYSAAHILCALPGLNSADEISKKLKLDLKLVKEVLQFLDDRGFVKKKAGEYAIGARRMHLKKGSDMLPRHHVNWRMKAIESVDHERDHDLHYSAILGIAKKDVPLLKEKLLKTIEEFEPLVADSKEEVPVAMLIDWFEL